MANRALLSMLLALLYAVSFSAGDLRGDLRDFMALVPRRQINRIAARYYIFDPKFRHASDFLRGDEFPKTWQQIRATPDFADLVDYINEYGSGYNVSSVLDKLPNRLRSFQNSISNLMVSVQMMLRRDLTTFLREIIQILPRPKIYNLIVRKVSKGDAFAKLYKALRDKEFRVLVNTARRSPHLKVPLSRMSKNYINVDEIIQITFELINWGPQPS